MEDMGWCRYLTWKRRLSNERQTDGSTDTKKQNSIPWDIPRCYDKLRIWKKGPFGSGQERLCIGGGLKAPPSYSSCERRCSSSQWLKWMMERDLLKARGERANLGAVCLVTTLCPLSMAGSLELEFFSVLPLLESSWPIFREMNQYQSQRFACSSRLTPYHWNHRKPGFSLPFGRR